MSITEFSLDLKSFSFRESIPRSIRAKPIGVTTAKKTVKSVTKLQQRGRAFGDAGRADALLGDQTSA